mmetsp:Transcript_26727/g.103844  ORF Transcript_26727/g.103844 Transcript_26727/m.103844 type:complete len:286 (+) Transcript_26727:138-995(+)
MGVGETENQASALESPTVTIVEKPKSFTSWWRISEVQGVICALSIWTCYLYYGFLHEKMFKVEYGGERFSYSIFLVFMQCIFNMAAAGIVLQLFPQERRDTTPHSSYALVSLSYLGAMVCSFTALHYISYPMQVLVKSCKMIPVMVMGVIISKRRYSWKETMCVLMITAGVAIFSYKPKAAQTGETSLIGILLLAASLICDGFTGPFQVCYPAKLILLKDFQKERLRYVMRSEHAGENCGREQPHQPPDDVLAEFLGRRMAFRGIRCIWTGSGWYAVLLQASRSP